MSDIKKAYEVAAIALPLLIQRQHTQVTNKSGKWLTYQAVRSSFHRTSSKKCSLKVAPDWMMS